MSNEWNNSLWSCCTPFKACASYLLREFNLQTITNNLPIQASSAPAAPAFSMANNQSAWKTPA